MRSVTLQPAPAPVSQALILICEKCGRKCERGAGNPAEDLQKGLKSRIKELGLKGEVRALLTGCMDVCPKYEVAIAVSRTDRAGGQDRFFTLTEKDLRDPDVAAQAVLGSVLAEE